jgi:hypothetical protein
MLPDGIAIHETNPINNSKEDESLWAKAAL